MSFFSGLGRMVRGEPVFQDSDNQERSRTAPTQPDQAPSEKQGPSFDKGDERSFPVVEIVRVDSRHEGERLKIYGWIKNQWPEQIMLDKIRIMGMKRELDTYLNGNEERQFLLYDGPRPKTQVHEAELDYKTQNEGDYFQAIHDVGFEYHEKDASYSVDELRLRRPIRDIYG